MISKVLFLDRDGVLNRDKGYVSKIEDIEVFPRTFESLRSIQEKGYVFFVITNQSGIGRGYLSLDEYLQLEKNFRDLYRSHGVNLVDFFFCPHDPTKIECGCRKPGIELFESAIAKHNLSLENSVMIGDKYSDLHGAQNVGVQKLIYLSSRLPSDIPANFVWASSWPEIAAII
ncbi:MAG: HAD family hydrolase [Pseudomonadota bacterium]|nr:HAD family hydrolase [Pseudomonadota bacterium]